MVWCIFEVIDLLVFEWIVTVRVEVCCWVWVVGVDFGFYVIDIDVMLITAHFDK